LIRNPYDQKDKDNLVKLYTYISRNRLGITNQFKLKDKEIERARAIEPNINKVIAARFKKQGMSWSKRGGPWAQVAPIFLALSNASKPSVPLRPIPPHSGNWIYYEADSIHYISSPNIFFD
jgi:hypothetical protein